MHLFLEKGPWFRAKRFGYGTGLPFKWQGWVFLALHIAVLAGIGLMAEKAPAIMIPLIFLAAIAPISVYKARTEGGWRWRWGEESRVEKKPRRGRRRK